MNEVQFLIIRCYRHCSGKLSSDLVYGTDDIGTTHIADRLREEHAECPAYHAIKLGTPVTGPPENPWDWKQSAVAMILARTEYLGHTHVDELAPTLLNELVERVEIHAPDKSSGKRGPRD